MCLALLLCYKGQELFGRQYLRGKIKLCIVLGYMCSGIFVPRILLVGDERRSLVRLIEPDKPLIAIKVFTSDQTIAQIHVPIFFSGHESFN